MNYPLEQLEEGRLALEKKIRQARENSNLLPEKLSRLVAVSALGEDNQEEIESTRRQLAEYRQVIEETPGALLLLKAWITEAEQAKMIEDKQKEAIQTLQSYFSARQEVLADPMLACRQISAGNLNGLSARLDSEVDNYRLPRPPVKFSEEVRQLIAKATEYCHIRRDSAFSFTILIPEGYQEEK